MIAGFDAGPIAAALRRDGIVVVPRFLDQGAVRALGEAVAVRDARGDFRPAAIGAGAQRAVRPWIRGDRIHWLVTPMEAEEGALALLEQLRTGLNEELGLGLFELECHYAVYPSGGRYARHLDRSPAGAERVVSMVLYLNEGWEAADGGVLRVYADPPVDVVPAGGTLVLFMSEALEHEVLEARRERRSLTGWFRRRAPWPAG